MNTKAIYAIVAVGMAAAFATGYATGSPPEKSAYELEREERSNRSAIIEAIPKPPDYLTDLERLTWRHVSGLVRCLTVEHLEDGTHRYGPPRMSDICLGTHMAFPEARKKFIDAQAKKAAASPDEGTGG